MEEATQVPKQKHPVPFITLNPSADDLLEDNTQETNVLWELQVEAEGDIPTHTGHRAPGSHLGVCL